MSARPLASPAPRAALYRSIPFWILLVGSLASAVVGVWLILDKINTMTSTLADGSATGVEVYAGQSWVVVGGALLAAGLFGFIAALALAVARSFVPTPVIESVEPIDWNAADDDDIEEIDIVVIADAPVADAVVADAPVADAPAKSVPADEVVADEPREEQAPTRTL